MKWAFSGIFEQYPGSLHVFMHFISRIWTNLIHHRVVPQKKENHRTVTSCPVRRPLGEYVFIKRGVLLFGGGILLGRGTVLTVPFSHFWDSQNRPWRPIPLREAMAI